MEQRGGGDWKRWRAVGRAENGGLCWPRLEEVRSSGRGLTRPSCGRSRCGEKEVSSLSANADDRLSRTPPSREERFHGVVESGHVADVRPEPALSHPPGDLGQLSGVGLDHEVDSLFECPGDAHQGAPGADQLGGSLLDVATDDIEDQVDPADVLEGVMLEIDELVGTEIKRLLAVGRPSGTDHVELVSEWSACLTGAA